MNRNFFISAIVGTITGFLNGLFGSGGGSIAVPCLEKFKNLEPHKAHATAISIILPLCIVSIFVYSKHTTVEFQYVLFVSIGGIIGGYIGAKFLKKISPTWLHRIFGIFMLIGAWRMIR